MKDAFIILPPGFTASGRPQDLLVLSDGLVVDCSLIAYVTKEYSDNSGREVVFTIPIERLKLKTPQATELMEYLKRKRVPTASPGEKEDA